MEIKDLLKELVSRIDTEKINSLLKELENSDSYNSVIDLYNSIWKMTYKNSLEIGIEKISQLSISHRISLMNEQGDLIPSELVPINEVKTLDLGGFPEAVLFPELLKYTNLKKLDLWDNNLTKLPDSLFQLTSLESLYICDQLTELPPELNKLNNLKHLDLNGNNLTSLPDQLATLDKLIVLNLEHNRIDKFSLSLKNMTNIQKINLRFNSEKLIIDPDILKVCRNRKIELIY